MIAIALLALLIFIFFFLSIRVEDNISFTDDLPTITTPTVTIADQQIGSASAKVTIVEFGDFQCPTCDSVDTALFELLQIYPDDLRLVWKDMPNTSTHSEALNAALAARCAAKQDSTAFFPYHDYLFANQSKIGASLYSEIATTLKLNTKSFTNCLTNQDTLPLVERTYEEGLALNISVTPTIFINGTRFTGNLTKADINAAIKAALH